MGKNVAERLGVPSAREKIRKPDPLPEAVRRRFESALAVTPTPEEYARKLAQAFDAAPKKGNAATFFATVGRLSVAERSARACSNTDAARFYGVAKRAFAWSVLEKFALECPDRSAKVSLATHLRSATAVIDISDFVFWNLCADRLTRSPEFCWP